MTTAKQGMDHGDPRAPHSTERTRLLWLTLAITIMTVATAQAQTSYSENLLHNFSNFPRGANPPAGVIRDSAGNLYGTTLHGGAANAGVVYKLNTAGHETVLHSFTGGADGGEPYAGVIRDSAGNLYGTTLGGGAMQLGVVYEVDTAGQETVLHREATPTRE